MNEDIRIITTTLTATVVLLSVLLFTVALPVVSTIAPAFELIPGPTDVVGRVSGAALGIMLIDNVVAGGPFGFGPGGGVPLGEIGGFTVSGGYNSA